MSNDAEQCIILTLYGTSHWVVVQPDSQCIVPAMKEQCIVPLHCSYPCRAVHSNLSISIICDNFSYTTEHLKLKDIDIAQHMPLKSSAYLH